MFFNDGLVFNHSYIFNTYFWYMTQSILPLDDIWYIKSILIQENKGNTLNDAIMTYIIFLDRLDSYSYP